MRIGLIADTHIPEAAAELPPEVGWAFSGVDLILHAGDLHVLGVLDWLERLAPVKAARGNGDDGGGGRLVVPPDPRLRETWVLQVDGLRIGVTHEPPLPEYPWRPFQSYLERNFGGRVDVVVYGDTHVAKAEDYQGVLLVNPGSPTLPGNLIYGLGTVALLELDDGAPRVTTLDLSSFRRP